MRSSKRQYETEILTFGGKEKTYQAWNGIDKATYESNPKFNYSGAIYDANWENIIGFMIMKPIITDKTIIIYFGNKNSVKFGI